MNERHDNDGRSALALILCLALGVFSWVGIVLKACGLIGLSWGVVLSPIWAPVALLALLFFFAMIEGAAIGICGGARSLLRKGKGSE